MKMKNNILFFVLLLLPIGLYGQPPQQQGGDKPPMQLPQEDVVNYSDTAQLFQGVMVGVDLFDPVAQLLGQNYGGYMLHVEVDLMHRFFPVWEIGVGSAYEKPDDMNYTYTGNTALYNRIGMNYNFTYKNPAYDFFYVGFRYGFSTYSYEITDISMESSYWEQIYTTNIYDQHASAHWFEGVVGVQVDLYKGLMLGWSVAYKWMLYESTPKGSDPWYIPGFGTKSLPVGFTYTIGYRLPL